MIDNEFELRLEEEIEHWKNLLFEHDRTLSDEVSRGVKPSLAEKKARSRIIRHLNRSRRQLYRLRRGAGAQTKKKITFRVSEEVYAQLQSMAEQEGFTLSAYIRKRLLSDS